MDTINGYEKLSFESFCDSTKWKMNKLNNYNARRIYELLIKPNVVNTMITFSNFGIPAITAVAELLEQNFMNDAYFPLYEAVNRRYVGRMMSYIMILFGYKAVGQSRIRTFSKTQVFHTGAVYRRDISIKPTYVINNEICKVY